MTVPSSTTATTAATAGGAGATAPCNQFPASCFIWHPPYYSFHLTHSSRLSGAAADTNATLGCLAASLLPPHQSAIAALRQCKGGSADGRQCRSGNDDLRCLWCLIRGRRGASTPLEYQGDGVRRAGQQL